MPQGTLVLGRKKRKKLSTCDKNTCEEWCSIYLNRLLHLGSHKLPRYLASHKREAFSGCWNFSAHWSTSSYLNYTLSTCGAWRKQTSSSGTSIICKAVKTLPCLVCQHVEERYEASNEKMASCPSAGPAVSQKESIQCIHYIRRDTALQTKKSSSSVRNFQQGP